MARNAQDPRDSLNFLQQLLTSPAANALFGGFGGQQEQKKSSNATVALDRQEPLDDKGIVSEGVIKLLTKELGGKAVEALQATGDINQVIDSLNEMLPQGQQAVPGPQGSIAIGQQQPETPVAITPEQQAQLISQALAGQSPEQEQAQVPQAPAQQPEDTRDFLTKLFGAIGIKPSSGTELRTAQTALLKQELAQGGKIGQAEQKAQLQLELAKFTQDRLDQREVLKAQLKDSGVDDVTAGLNLLATDVANLAEARREIFVRGRVFGKLSGLVSAFGPQRARRAVAESFAEVLLFSFGEHVIKQKGRAFIGEEQKRVKKNVIGAFLSETEGVFNARMNAIIKQINNRLPEGASKIPDLETLLSTRSQKNVSQIKQQAAQSITTSSGSKFIIKQRGE